ncbi:MAG: hypothetical protein RJA70_1803, partial [Pseudomonadota bacterium]
DRFSLGSDRKALPSTDHANPFERSGQRRLIVATPDPRATPGGSAATNTSDAAHAPNATPSGSSATYTSGAAHPSGAARHPANLVSTVSERCATAGGPTCGCGPTRSSC